MMKNTFKLAGNLALTLALAAAGIGAANAADKVKVGLMLPYTGTYAALGTAITTEQLDQLDDEPNLKVEYI